MRQPHGSSSPAGFYPNEEYDGPELGAGSHLDEFIANLNEIHQPVGKVTDISLIDPLLLGTAAEVRTRLSAVSLQGGTGSDPNHVKASQDIPHPSGSQETRDEAQRKHGDRRPSAWVPPKDLFEEENPPDFLPQT